MDSKFLRIFALEVQLSSLSLHACTFWGSSDEEALACLGKLRGLKALSISLFWPPDLQVSCLSELKQLESLALHHCTPVGLNLVLRSTPSLRELCLFIPPGEQVASDSLQTLSIESLSPSSSSLLSLSNLPSLRSISFRILNSSYSEEGGIDLIKRDILKLASLPLSTLGDLDLGGNRSWSADFTLSLLLALASIQPLSAYFSKINRLDLSNWFLVPGAMRAFAALFPSVVSITICCCKYLDYDDGLLDAVENMKSLRSIQICMQRSDRLPTDVIAALSFAKNSGRSLLVKLTGVRSDPLRLHGAKIVSEQWSRMTRGLKCPDVKFQYM
jgi:hypothetical protein